MQIHRFHTRTRFNAWLVKLQERVRKTRIYMYKIKSIICQKWVTYHLQHQARTHIDPEDKTGFQRHLLVQVQVYERNGSSDRVQMWVYSENAWVCAKCVLAFITHVLCINGIQMTFVWLIQYTLRYIFFKFVVCFIVLTNLGETCR